MLMEKKQFYYECAMFVFDSFHGPTTEWVKVDVNEVSNFLLIPGGMTQV
jgi:hypothetical protein